MKNKVMKGVLAAVCMTTAVSATTVFGADAEQSLVHTDSAEETEETRDAEQAGEENQKTVDETEQENTESEAESLDQTTGDTASDLPSPAAETQNGETDGSVAAVQAGSYYPWVKENGIWYFQDPDGTIVKEAWREYDKNLYYLNADGKMAVGWKQLNGAW